MLDTLSSYWQDSARQHPLHLPQHGQTVSSLPSVSLAHTARQVYFGTSSMQHAAKQRSHVTPQRIVCVRVRASHSIGCPGVHAPSRNRFHVPPMGINFSMSLRTLPCQSSQHPPSIASMIPCVLPSPPRCRRCDLQGLPWLSAY